ncbi:MULTISPECIES: MetQ/NlpA family ABC transporter substrate-binding protein [Aerococcus]|nr:MULTISPECIES: MetQ/NlpA family ABC transporter substrate-binding protein [Aerococcus]MDK6369213.1 MetQ/NlpA family ABC transporter substrate-binding protein [Aerococcus sp. UMB9870]MDK6679037.1 MetQ/NlpA family ABC transporter substrate-binding protein [Aerococcus sp. UMB8608]MDK6687415.1 MetQ/NlpA family ABC transporter substrate-binding protein [Aerococcus sp. UMB8623]MDK6940099.1 MetQ/NlpA family ABC transporter substrate-binding protein [Aerococcus sp. UMB8487]
MRKRYLMVFAILGLLVLGGCQAKQDQSKVYKIGVATDRAAEIFRHVGERLEKEEGIQIEPIVFSDFVQPNVALAEGDIAANAYQYAPFLADFNQSHQTDLVPLGYLSVEPMGIWASAGIESLDQVPEGARIAVTNDPINTGNALIQLEKAGLLTLKDSAGALPTQDDIASNPKRLEFIAMDGGQVPRALGDTELILTGVTIASEAGLAKESAIYFEDTSNTSKLFRLNFVVRREDLDDPILRKILDYYQSEDTVRYAQETGSGTFYPGWGPGEDATRDYDAFVQEEA